MGKSIKTLARNKFILDEYLKYFEHLTNIDSPIIDRPEKESRKQNALKSFNIVFGYYLFLDEQEKTIEVNPKQYNNKNNGNTYKIPFQIQSGDLLEEDILEEIKEKKSRSKFFNYSQQTTQNYPFEYRFLPKIIEEKDAEYRKSWHYSILKNHNFSVVLSEEILFWIILQHGVDNEAVKVLLKSQQNKSQLNNYCKNICNEHEKLSSFESYDKTLVEYKKNVLCLEEKDNVYKLARFDIDIALEFALAHSQNLCYDFFVFPIVTKNVEYGIKNPILLCCYIKNIAEITKNLDNIETKDTLEGFKVIEMICEHVSKDFVDEVYYGNVKYNEKKKEAEKSAKAAIMARNMSHNLGSHILYYLKESLKDVSNILDSNVLDNLYNLIKVQNYNVKDLYKNLTAGQVKLPFLVGLGRFLNYLQERQEFIATICGDKIPAFSTINFKEYVIDEFNYDAKIVRHLKHSPPSVKKVNIERNIILANIARSEKYNGAIEDHENLEDDKRSLKIYFNGKDLVLPITIDEEHVRNFDIEVPGGIIGRQAFFSILENIIRNSAKHAKKAKDKELIIDIRLVDEDKDYQEVEIVQQKPINIADFKKLEINLCDELIGDNLELNQQNKGLKEIRISAAYLLGIQNINNTIEYKGEQRKILTIHKKEQDFLAFSFLLRKPKELVYVTEKPESEIQSVRAKMTEINWGIYNYKAFLEQDSNYKIVIIDEDLSQEQIENLKLKSSRFIVLKDFISEVESRNLDDLFIDKIDEYLESNIYKGRVPKILIDDSQILDERFQNSTENEKFLLNFLSVNGKRTDSTRWKLGVFTLDAFQVDKNQICLPKNNILITLQQHLHNAEEIRTKLLSKLNYPNFYNAIESITGNNATSRVVRNDLKDRYWYRQVIEAGLLKVLLIDERMFSTNKHTINKAFSNKVFNHLLNRVKTCENYKKAKIFVGLNEEIISYFTSVNSQNTGFGKTIKDYLHQIRLGAENEDDLKKSVVDYFKRISVIFINMPNSKNELLELKNIYVGDFDEELTTLNLTNNTSICTAKYDEFGFEINLIDKNESFHICSIHQGIIDKMASKLGKFQNIESHDIYTQVYAEIKKKLPFTMKFIVHSGRSRPPFLPDDIPFLPFVSLENLITDAKVSFVSPLIDAKII